MKYVEQSLSDGEEIAEIFYFHWIMWLWFWFWMLVAIPIFDAIFSLIGAIFALIIFIRLKTTEHGLTNKRVVFKKGFISRQTEEMRLSSIETVEIDQTVLGRLLGYGDIKITGRGTSDVVFKNLDDPLEVKRRIESISNPPV